MSASKRLRPGLFALFIALNLFVCGAINLTAPRAAAAGEFKEFGGLGFIENGTTIGVNNFLGEINRVHVNGLNGEKLQAIDFNLLTGFLGFGMHVIAVGDNGGVFDIGPDGEAVLIGRIPQQFRGAFLDIDINPFKGDIFVANDRGQVIKFNLDDPNTFRVFEFVYDKDDPNTGKKGKGVMTFSDRGAFLIDMVNKTLAKVINLDFGLIQTVGNLNLGNFFPFGFDTNPLTDVSLASIVTAGQTIPDLYEIDLTTGRATKAGTTGMAHNGFTFTPPPLKNLHCVLTPPKAVNKVGTEHTFNLRVFDGERDITDLIDLRVIFEVISGPNAGASKAQSLAFTYHSDGRAGTDTVEASVAHDGKLAECRATKEWVTTPHISSVVKDGKKLSVTGQFDSNGDNKVMVDGKEQKTKARSETELFSKKGGKKADTDSVVVVDSAGGPSNQFLIGQPPSTLTCELTPKMSTTRLAPGETQKHDVTLQVFVDGKLVSEELLVRFRRKTGPNKADGFNSFGPGGVFTHSYTSNGMAGFDLIEASGTFKGSPFTCFAVKKWE